MASADSLRVHLLPRLVEPAELAGGVVVVIDVLRASTTAVHALAAGCLALYPVATPEEAHAKAAELRQDGSRVIVGGERGGRPIPGFDLGNSPADYHCKSCKGTRLVLTTTNGTQALMHAAQADVVYFGAFVNFSAVGERLLKETRPIHLLCAGTDGHVTLEDTLLAGAFVELLRDQRTDLCDSARVAWDCHEHHGTVLTEAFRLSRGGRNLIDIGYEDDLALAAQIDRFMIVPTLRRDPFRMEVGGVGLVRNLWPGR